MILQGNLDYCEASHPYPIDPFEQWKIVNYGDESGSIAPHTFLQERTLVNSSATTFVFNNKIFKGGMNLVTSGTSSSMILDSPETAWFLNDKKNRVIVFPKKKLSSKEMSGACFQHTEVPQTLFSKQLVQVSKKIGKFARFAENWDSYEAKAISSDCIIRGFDILKELINLKTSTIYEVPIPFVAPLSSGGIQFEWEKGERYLEISITPNPTTIDYFIIDKTKAGQLSLEGLLKSASFLKELLSWFINGTADDLSHLSFEVDNQELAF